MCSSSKETKTCRPCLPRPDDPLAAQQAQLVRYGGFTQPDLGDQMPDVQLPIQQRGDDADACGVAEGFEQVGDIDRGAFIENVCVGYIHDTFQ